MRLGVSGEFDIGLSECGMRVKLEVGQGVTEIFMARCDKKIIISFKIESGMRDTGSAALHGGLRF